jgi:hypothetical protein
VNMDDSSDCAVFCSTMAEKTDWIGC